MFFRDYGLEVDLAADFWHYKQDSRFERAILLDLIYRPAIATLDETTRWDT